MDGQPATDAVTMVNTPKWPKVVGIISIVFGSLGVLGSTCGGIGVAMVPVWEDMMKEVSEGYPLPPNMDIGPLYYVLIVLGLAFAILLLTAGVMTLKRQIAGRMLHLVYVGLSIPVTILNIWLQMQEMSAMEAYIRDNPGSPFAQGGDQTVNLILFAFFTLLGIAWLAFLGIWFGVMKTKPSDFTGDPADDAEAASAADDGV